MQRFHFHTRVRKKDEAVAIYLAELKSLAQKCNFKAGTLHEMLRDRLVCGINEDSIQKRLLSETKLTYKSAVNKAQAMEATMEHVKEMQAAKKLEDETAVTEEQVHMVQCQQRGRPSQGFSSKECYRCGNTNHTADRCRLNVLDAVKWATLPEFVVVRKEGLYKQLASRWSRRTQRTRP